MIYVNLRNKMQDSNKWSRCHLCKFLNLYKRIVYIVPLSLSLFLWAYVYVKNSCVGMKYIPINYRKVIVSYEEGKMKSWDFSCSCNILFLKQNKQ